MRRALVLAFALSLPACDGALLEQATVERDQSGSVRIVMATESDDGASYALRDSTVELSGSALVTLSSRGSHSEVLHSPLPPGSYTLFLRPGYRVVKIAADGSELPIEAELVSMNPGRFALAPFEDTTLELSFAVDEQRIVFGRQKPLRMTGLLR